MAVTADSSWAKRRKSALILNYDLPEPRSKLWRNAIGELAILTVPILAATVVRAFTNPRLGKIKFVSAVAHWAQ